MKDFFLKSFIITVPKYFLQYLLILILIFILISIIIINYFSLVKYPAYA